MDDLIFKGKTKEELRQNMIEGLKILEKNDLYIKELKCYWEVDKVPVLGHIVGKGCLRMEAIKVKTILDWETPKNRKGIQKFNGFCNFNCCYVRGYSKVACPIMCLMGNAPFEWGPKEQAVFNKLKCLITSEEVTTQPCPTGKFRMEVDASGYALGGVLSQLQDDKWQSIAFILRTMTDAKLNYDICNEELLAIMYASKEWHPYLLDARELLRSGQITSIL